MLWATSTLLRGDVAIAAAGDDRRSHPLRQCRGRSAGLTFVHRHSPTAEQALPRERAWRRGGLRLQRRRPARHLFHQRRRDAVARQDAATATPTASIATTAACTSPTSPRAAGVSGAGYAMGAAAADYDNDGHVDLFVAGVARNQLLRNRGDGGFEDVTEPRRASPAANGRRRPAGSTTTTTAGSICSSSTTSAGRRRAAATAATSRAASASTAIPGTSRACRTASIAIAATARSRTSRPRPGSPGTSARG